MKLVAKVMHILNKTIKFRIERYNECDNIEHTILYTHNFDKLSVAVREMEHHGYKTNLIFESSKPNQIQLSILKNQNLYGVELGNKYIITLKQKDFTVAGNYLNSYICKINYFKNKNGIKKFFD